MSSAGPDVLVVGGGVIGASVAYHVAREGLSVTLLERGTVASAASGAAAGMLTPLGEAAGKGGAFLDFGLRSLARFPDLARELADRSGVDPEWVRSGALHVARSDARATTLKARARDLPGVGARWLDADPLRERAPLLAEDVRGGLHSPHDAHVNSPQLVRAYLGAARSFGVRIETDAPVGALLREGERVVGVRTAGGVRHAGTVVLCAGAWSPALLAPLGIALPVEPVRGQILSLEAPDGASEIWIDEDVYVVPKRDGRLVVGATEERVGFDDQVTAEGVVALLRAAFVLAPELARQSFVDAWAGLRPCTPDALPAIGPAPGVTGLVLACGHHRNGVLLSPITGELVAGCVQGHALPDDAAAFDPARFRRG